MLRVLLTRRWILLTLLFVVLILIMGRLGLWQYHRYQQTKRSNHRISLAVHAKPVPMQALTHPGANLPGNERYRPVTATGHYDPAHQFVVRRRTNSDGSLGFFLVTPLITTDGDAVLVNRGWVAPAADAAAFPAVPKTPTGTVTLTGRLQLDETSRISGIRDVGGLPARQYMLINSGQQAKRLPEPVLSGYLELVKTSPSPAKGQTAEQIAAPGSDNQSDTDMAVVGQGVHLPYAIQWWLFVLMVPVGWWILLRQDLKERRKKAAAAVPAAAVATPAEPKIKAEQAVRTDAEVRAEPEVKDDSESKPEAGAATETGPAAGSDAGAATEAGSEAAARS